MIVRTGRFLVDASKIIAVSPHHIYPDGIHIYLPDGVVLDICRSAEETDELVNRLELLMAQSKYNDG